MLITVRNLKRLINEAVLVNGFVDVLSNVRSGNVQVSVDSFNGVDNVFVKLIKGDDKIVEQELVDLAHKYGWLLLSKRNKETVTWWFEPSPEIKGQVSRKKLPQILYHVTNVNKLESIMMLGLIPGERDSSSLRKYAGRIYLATSQSYALGMIKTKDKAMLSIDLSLISKTNKFFVDQEFGFDRKTGIPRSVFTMQPISQNAITIIE